MQKFKKIKWRLTCTKPAMVMTVIDANRMLLSHVKSDLLLNVYKVRPTTMAPVKKTA